MKYVVTGGYGFIGSQLANALKGDVTIISKTNTHKKKVIRPVHEIIKNINNITPKDIEGADVIYHLASTVDNYHILDDPYLDIDTNLKGTINLLECIKNLPKKPKLIYSSSFFVYGNVYEEDQKPINEISRTDPLALYPATKLCAENIIKCYAKLYDFPYIIVRFSNVYGDQEEVTSKKAALNLLIWKAVHGEIIPVYNNGNFYRDYIYVDDVVRALQLLEEKVHNDTFLIAYGKKVKFKDMIDFLLSKTKGSSLKSLEPPFFHQVVGIRNFVTDTSKINKLGWSPTIDYKEGISRIIKKYKKSLNSS